MHLGVSLLSAHEFQANLESAGEGGFDGALAFEDGQGFVRVEGDGVAADADDGCGVDVGAGAVVFGDGKSGSDGEEDVVRVEDVGDVFDDVEALGQRGAGRAQVDAVVGGDVAKDGSRQGRVQVGGLAGVDGRRVAEIGKDLERRRVCLE